jgi:dolichol-phosphate mannosyltransferase
MNKTANYDLTIIVPVYNEADNFVRIEQEFTDFLNKTSDFSACILFVDDGSIDQSRTYISQLCQRKNDFFYLLLKGNHGLSTAIKAGIDYCQSTYTGYIDADLQTSPEDFKRLMPYIKDYAMVTGIRTKREDGFIKKISSKIANGYRRFMTKDGIDDTGCPLKIIRSEYAKRVPFFNGMHRFLPALIMLQDGGTVKQVPVRHFPRTTGKSKYHLWNRLYGPFIDCFVYRWMKKRSINVCVEENNIL